MSAAAELEPPDPGGLAQLLLRDQQRLSAVERFAQRHAEAKQPLQARYYHDLIPVGRPGAGEQLAFQIDLDACTGCKACVAACHSLNGLAEEETWRDVGLVLGVVGGQAYQQTVTTACHHCEDPACLAGCPARAYEKDPVTGIVRHLDDQCIGCQYCTLTCPYDVPKYDEARGIVRKCDMCAGRLAVNQAPACVQGCPNQAISIRIVERRAQGAGGDPRPSGHRPDGPKLGAASRGRAKLRSGPDVLPLLPGLEHAMPDSAHTRPTTRYVSRREVTALRPAGDAAPEPARAHPPLVWMLVFTQLSLGLVAGDAWLSAFAPDSSTSQALRLGLAAATAFVGVAAGTFHLGRPRHALRAVLGWRTSWMSREVIAFGAYVPAVAALALASAVSLPPELESAALGLLQPVALALGIAALACSVMLYAATRRALWSLPQTALRFAGTAALLGALGCAATAPIADAALLAIVLGAGKLALELRVLCQRGASDLARSARLLEGTLAARFLWRMRVALLAGAFCAAAIAAGSVGAPAIVASAAWLALAAAFAGEWLERDLFFRAEAARAMPGL